MPSFKRNAARILLLMAALVAVALTGGCSGEPTVKTTVETTPTSTAPAYQRQALPYFRGIDEPRAEAWENLVIDRDRLRQVGFNTATLSPPVLISQRAGGQPRLILEGDAGSVPGLTDDLHAAGLSVFICPTTAANGFRARIEVTAPALAPLTEDARRWAVTAEEKHAELYSPLTDYNLALGTEAANRWSAEILPLVRQKFRGDIVARVVPDISGATPAPGAPHDFEQLDYRGYDYLMLDVSPQGPELNLPQLEAGIDDLLARASAIAQRDGLKGVLLEFGAWRAAAGADTVDGPLLGEDNQALAAEWFMRLAMPRAAGVFWRGWTLAGRGARGFKAEEALRRSFGGAVEAPPAAAP